MTDHTDLRRIADAATRGPWKWEEPSTDPWPTSDQSLVTDYVPEGENYPKAVLMGWGYDASGTEASDEDRAFMAAAHPGTVLALLDEIEALRAEREPVVVDDATEWEYAHAANGYWNEDETEFTPEEWLDVDSEAAGALARRKKAGQWIALTPDGQKGER